MMMVLASDNSLTHTIYHRSYKVSFVDKHVRSCKLCKKMFYFLNRKGRRLHRNDDQNTTYYQKIKMRQVLLI